MTAGGPDGEPILVPEPSVAGKALGMPAIVVVTTVGAGYFFYAGVEFGSDPWWLTVSTAATGVVGLVGALVLMHRRAEYDADRAQFQFMLGVMEGRARRAERDAQRDDS